MVLHRITTPLLLVVGELLKNPLDEHWGYRLSQATGLAPGTIQPILSRLEGEGWFEVRWEDIDAVQEGRRPRRLYRLTGTGVKAAQALLNERQLQTKTLREWSTGQAPA